MSVLPSLRNERAASLPPSVHDASARLESAGFEAWLVGESLLRILMGRTPDAFELATSAPAERALDLFPHAVPTHLERGVVTVPSGRIPVDLSSFRCGPSVTDDLAQRDFTVLAMAYRPASEAFLDPHEGHSDLEARLLRCVGESGRCLAKEPLRLLRAARLVSTYGLAPHADLEAAMAAAGDSWTQTPAPRLRRELSRLLLADRPETGLALLRRTGLERQLVRGSGSDAGALIRALPRDLPVRLAAWLRGTRPRGLLRRLRFGLERSRRVERLLEHHPLDACVNPSRDRALSRLLRQLSRADIDALFEMREWELQQADEPVDVAEARKRLEAVRSGIERVRLNRERSLRRTVLALDGREVMQLLGCGPGSRVGAALRHLAEIVDADPGRNEPAALRQALLEWDARGADETGPMRDRPES